ncbi:MAG: protease modulator HflC [Chthoniobacterales bacterium]|nr:protease modulator HflC [Chthoniobacterales bacterium]
MSPKLIIPIFFLCVILILAANSLYTIDEAEQALIIQLGKPVGGPITTPGLHFKLPFLQEVRRFDKRLFSWDGDPEQIPTKGEQFISVDTTARWRISDPLKFLQRVQNEMGATLRLNDILDSIVRDHISASDLIEIVRSKDWAVSREDIERVQAAGEGEEQILLQKVKTGREEITRSILNEARKQLPDLGIELVDIRIKRVDYVESVQQRVFERMIAERQRIAEKFRSEGQGRAAEIDGNTQRQLSLILSEARRKAEVIRGRADAEAARIYREAYSQNPEFYTFLRTIEIYPKIFNSNSTLLLSSNAPLFRYLSEPFHHSQTKTD